MTVLPVKWGVLSCLWTVLTANLLELDPTLVNKICSGLSVMSFQFSLITPSPRWVHFPHCLLSTTQQNLSFMGARCRCEEICSLTRLHSSRMHTACSLTVSPSMLCSRGGGAYLVPGAGGGIPACTEVDPPVDRITDACENITLPQLGCGR